MDEVEFEYSVDVSRCDEVEAELDHCCYCSAVVVMDVKEM